MQRIGRYEIKRELGRGGMAAVYEAYDPRFKRDVAIKMLPQAFSHDPQFRARFEREAQTIAMLEHPAIVPVYDYGEENGRLYLVMRLMTGGSLADRLRRGPLSPQEASEIMNHLAPALDAAHARGMIHRDLKPANILFDQWNKPYLSDFGIVKLASESGTSLTATGGLIGTPAYMSPEQVQGDETLDGRSDIYSLGIILFETLTGQTPYNAPTPMGLAFKQVNEPTPRLGSFNMTLPSGCQRVIEQAMAKNKDQRFLTAQAMANSLTQAITGAGNFDATAIEDDNWYQPPPQPKRKIPIWAWLGGVVLLAICGVISAAVVIIFLNNGNPLQVQNTEAATKVVEVAATTVEESVSVVGEPTKAPTAETTNVPEAAPLPTMTATAESKPTATRTPTPTPSPTAVVVQQQQLGRSTENRPIDLYSVGNGRHHIVVIGALHGNEPGTEELVSELATHFTENPDLVAQNFTLHFIPGLNPDGLTRNSRYTANIVDINRNWDTPNWVSNAPQPDHTTGTGGPSPFSEPETAALAEFFESLQDNALSISVVVVHAHTGVTGTGRVQPGYIQPGNPVEQSITLANTLIHFGDYEYVETCCGSYTPTGEISNWCAIHGISAVDMELPSGGFPDQVVESKTILERSIQSILGLMAV
ncbi:MAG: protein kinase [Candidatus Promineifilaceae bacterium]